MNEGILVSIIVVTYNSSSTIIETLESISKQKYKRLELIITDDYSSDDTIDKVRQWVSFYEKRFERTTIITSDVNTGVSANINRGIKCSIGKWVKTIAGDDLLLDNSISTFVSQIKNNGDICIFFSQVCLFRSNSGKNEMLSVLPNNDMLNLFNKKSNEAQLLDILNDIIPLPAGSLFIRRDVVDTIHFNELYRYMEDYPMWITLSSRGYKFLIIDEVTVLYRIGNSLSHRRYDYYSRKYMETKHLFFWLEYYNLVKDKSLVKAYNKYRKELLLYELTEALTQNKKSFVNKIIRMICKIIVQKIAKFEF